MGGVFFISYLFFCCLFFFKIICLHACMLGAEWRSVEGYGYRICLNEYGKHMRPEFCSFSFRFLFVVLSHAKKMPCPCFQALPQFLPPCSLLLFPMPQVLSLFPILYASMPYMISILCVVDKMNHGRRSSTTDHLPEYHGNNAFQPLACFSCREAS
jgi:hypothetical protein